MNYIIDGHNLIPKLGGSLKAMDDEQMLIDLLQQYARASRNSIEVFFDGAPPTLAGKRSYGTITAHFVRKGRTADEAIRLKMEQLGSACRNFTIVSSDRQVQAEARAHLAHVLSSEDFARELQTAKAAAPAENREAPISHDDLDEWLSLFGGEPDNLSSHHGKKTRKLR